MIAPQQQIALLQGLLECYSPTLAEEAAVGFLARWMEERGFQVQVDETGSVSGSLGDGPREILLLGHIDTVPGVIPVRVEGGLLYGRGAVDAKGPLACFACAAAASGALPGWKVTVLGATGEEGDSRGAKLVRNRLRPELCIIGEPGGWEHLTLGYKGSAWYQYTVHRPLAHTAGQAKSACEEAVAFWNRAQARASEYNQGHTRLFDQLSASLRGMNSDEDGLTQSARLAFNLRLPPGLGLRALDEMLNEIRGDGELACTDGIESYRAEKNTPLARALLSAIRQEKGNPRFVVKTGTSDMNIVGPTWNIPILAYGPGDSNLDHTPNEHIALEEYLAGIRVLSRALEIIQR